MTVRRFYLAAFAGYLLSLPLPGLRTAGSGMTVWDAALILAAALAYWNGPLTYAGKLFLVLSGVLPAVAFVLHFRIGLRPLRWVQTAALLSATGWLGSAAWGPMRFQAFGVGFWLWYASLWGLCLCTWAGGPAARRPADIPPGAGRGSAD